MTAAVPPPPIEPVAQNAGRPRWSVMIPTYQCAALADATIRSVVDQAGAPDEMEIVVVDDASTDPIEEVVARYGGRVRLHRQPKNLGVPGNLTAAIQLARGELVHILHGDDLVRPGFYAAMERGFADPAIGAVWCRQIFADAHGEWVGVSPPEAPEGRMDQPARFLAEQQRIMTPSICVRRSAYEAVGGFHPALRCVEDWEMWVRIAGRYPIFHVREPLAVYRMHDQSNTGRNLRNAAEMDYAAKAIDLFSAHLPVGEARAVRRKARRSVALHALATSHQLARSGDRAAALRHLAVALRLSPSVETGLHAGYTLVRAAVARAGRG